MNSVRIDKFLWSVRLSKTRSLAAEACRKGRVKFDGAAAKPSRLVRAGERFELRRDGLWHAYEIVEVIEKRVGAALVEDHLADRTSPEVLAEIERRREERGRQRVGERPTKRDRRILDKLRDAGDEHGRHFREKMGE